VAATVEGDAVERDQAVVADGHRLVHAILLVVELTRSALVGEAGSLAV
jgi:hypothetical protein